MYIKVSNGSQVINMDAYALIDKLNIYMNNVKVKDLIPFAFDEGDLHE